MQFPLGLTAKLILAGVGQKLNRKRENKPIFSLDIAPATANSFAAESEEQVITAVQGCSAPVIWIAGSEPLWHPRVGPVTRAIVNCGRYIFVETDGALLRRRIHEFQPGPQLFFAVKLNGLEPSQDGPTGRVDGFRQALEGIRAARLSGFFICARTEITADTSLDEISELRKLLQSSGADGWVITASGENKRNLIDRQNALQQKVAKARLLIENRGWERFSRLVETSQNVLRAVEITDKKARATEGVDDACEESVRAL